MSGAMAGWRARAASADAVVARIGSGMNVFVHGAAATPTALLEALCRRDDLRDVRLWHLHLEGPVPEITAGAGVVTTRGHVHWVVTEHGAVNLHGRTLAKRGRLLVSIAHPDVRGELTERLRGLKRFV